MRTLPTWAGRSKFRYRGSVKEGVTIEYGNGFSFTQRIAARHFRDLLTNFRGRKVNIGTSRTSPPTGSVGEWLQNNVTKTAMASYVGSILVNENYATKVEGSTIKFEGRITVDKNLIIPLENLYRDSLSVLELRKARIILVSDLPSVYQEKLKEFGCRCKYALEMERVVGEKPRRTLDRALTVFKLFKDNLVLSKLVLFDDRHDILPHYTHWIDRHRGLDPYHIHTDEEIKFHEFWSEFVEVSPNNFAARRFHVADYRPYEPDRFVDYIEALEYLLVPKSGEGEIGFKFRLSGTLVLGKNRSSDERKRMFNDLRDAYDLRSAIVHGDQKRISKYARSKTWEEIIRPMRSLAREAIKYFFRERCLDSDDARKELIERKIIFDSEPG